MIYARSDITPQCLLLKLITDQKRGLGSALLPGDSQPAILTDPAFHFQQWHLSPWLGMIMWQVATLLSQGDQRVRSAEHARQRRLLRSIDFSPATHDPLLFHSVLVTMAGPTLVPPHTWLHTLSSVGWEEKKKWFCTAAKFLGQTILSSFNWKCRQLALILPSSQPTTRIKRLGGWARP